MSKDGGPLFPGENFTYFDSFGKQLERGHPGMSQRAYFAAHAPAMTEQWFKDSGGERHWLEAEASWRVAYADAMIAELAK